jgi:opacity protein-like surface antigen
MIRLRRRLVWAVPVALGAVLLLLDAHAQTVPSAFGPGHPVWAGAEYSNMNASFPYGTSQRLEGVGVFADLHLTYRLGLVGEARFLTSGGFKGSTEGSYLAGPKAFFFPRGNLHPYGKFLVGAGKIQYPYSIGHATYFALAPGAGADYRLSRRWMLRFEYEYQVWMGSPGYPNQPDHRLTPNGFHGGIAYRVF